ncbi:hypothetical protein T484DRAFT_1882644 [Baffinella frigidus]|nr:hypothetical protein T484DRAFT_1882644 [Cryptophyta sp. CCMP2293]
MFPDELGVDLLEAREKAAKRRSEDLSGLEARYQSEVNRMHEQNKKVLEEMEARRREENEKKANSLFFAAENRANELQREAETIREKTRTLTLKWAKKGALDEPALRAAFEPFGEIDRLVVGKKSGIIIFNGDAAAANAVHSVRASQLALVASAGLSVEWTGGDAPAATPAEQAASATDAAKPNGETAGDPAPLAGNVGAAAAFAALAGAKAGVGSPMPGVAGVAAAGSPMPSFSSWSPAQEGGGVAEGSILQHRDYESVTMMRMRQMSERQRLADELDAAETAEGK